MSKIGVGVGDDFPLDDGNPGSGGQGPESDREEFEAWKRRRDAWRAQRDEWRRQHAEWRAKRRAFKERVRQAARESFGADWEDYAARRTRHFGYRRRFPFFIWPVLGLAIPILVLVLIISLISAVFQSPFVFLGLAALAFGFAVWRHNHRHYYGACEDYDFDLKPASGPQPAGPQNNGTIVTPPPAPDNGKTAS